MAKDKKPTGLFARSPVCIPPDATPGQFFDLALDDGIMFVDRCEMAGRILIIHWLALFSESQAMYCRSRWEIDRLPEHEKARFREIWKCVTYSPH